MFVRVFPAVLPGVFPDRWLRPGSIAFSGRQVKIGFGKAPDGFIILSRGFLQAACTILNFNLSLLQPLFPGTLIFPAFGCGSSP